MASAGIKVPYEEPLNPELTIETDKASPEEAVSVIAGFLSGVIRT
jgi:adenylylsulfate kinase-like enzyme